MRSTYRALGAITFVAFVSYGGCVEGPAAESGKSLRTDAAKGARGVDLAIDPDVEDAMPGLAAERARGNLQGDKAEKKGGGANGKGGEGLSAADLEAAKSTSEVDGLVKLEELPAIPSPDAQLRLDGESEDLKVGDWVKIDREIVVVNEVPVVPAPLSDPQVLTVIPEADVIVREGIATVEASAIQPAEVVVVLVNEENEVIEKIVPCEDECAVDLGLVAHEQQADVLMVETADAASTSLVLEESDKVDAAIVEAAPSGGEREADLAALTARRRELRAEIRALTGEMKEVKGRLRGEGRKIQPALEKLRAKRLGLLEERKRIGEMVDDLKEAIKAERVAAKGGAKDAKNAEAKLEKIKVTLDLRRGQDLQGKLDELTKEREAKNMAIDAIQVEIKALKETYQRHRDEWAGLGPARDQIAVLRSEMRRVKKDMLELAEAREVYCSSTGSKYFECALKGDFSKVALADQVSAAACVKGESFGLKEIKGDSVLWVDRGCRARFLVTGRE